MRRSSGTCRSGGVDRKSTRLNSSHLGISYAVFCAKKKTDAGRRLDEVGAQGLLERKAPCGTPCHSSGGAGRHFAVSPLSLLGFFFNGTASTEIYTLSLHDALPISHLRRGRHRRGPNRTGAAARTDIQRHA